MANVILFDIRQSLNTFFLNLIFCININVYDTLQPHDAPQRKTYQTKVSFYFFYKGQIQCNNALKQLFCHWTLFYNACSFATEFYLITQLVDNRLRTHKLIHIGYPQGYLYCFSWPDNIILIILKRLFKAKIQICVN